MAQKRAALPAKLTPPRLYNPVPRARLYETLDAARAHPVIWIAAPPGAGKATLVASYLHASECPSLWYRMDAGDADPETLFYYLSVARTSSTPAGATALPAINPTHQRNLSGFARGYFRALYSGL